MTTYNKTLKFVGKEISKGLLQATGGIALYLLVFWFILSKYFKTDRLETALYAKTPGLYNLVNPGK
jgi:hypothetical protein